MTEGYSRPKSIQVGDLCKPCQMFVTWVGPYQKQRRGNPWRWKTSRKVLHVSGEYRAWHWEDQIGQGLHERSRTTTEHEGPRPGVGTG